MKQSGSGGGAKFQDVGIKAGPPSTNKMSPAAADMLGQQTAFKKPALQQNTMRQVPLGNDLATNVGKGGPGAGRTVYRSGSQAQTPPAREMPAGRDTLSEFGPERR